jgi:hypothetical protein
LRLIAGSLHRRPLPLGTLIGLLLAVGVSIFAPAEDMKPGDSRPVLAIVGAAFLVPGSIATALAIRCVARNFRRMRSLRFSWIFLVLFFTAAFSIEAYKGWLAAGRFGDEGRSAEGTVLEVHPEDHDKLLVRYSVADVTHVTRASGPRVARSYHVGEGILVYYYLSAPDEGFLIKPQWRPGLLLFTGALAVGVLPLWIIGIVLACRPRGPTDRTTCGISSMMRPEIRDNSGDCAKKLGQGGQRA